MLVRIPDRDAQDVLHTYAAHGRGVVSGPVYPPAPFRRRSAARFFAAATDGSGGRIDTPSPGIGGLADFTIGLMFSANVWPGRHGLLHQWGATDYTGNPLPGPSSWLMRVFQASGSPASGTWADGIQFWIYTSGSFRFMNIPLASLLSTERVQIVIRGQLGLESSPGVLAPDAQRLQAWLAFDADTALTPIVAGHGDGYGSTTEHPATMPATRNPLWMAGGPYGGAWDLDGDVFDAFCIPRALSDAEVTGLRTGADPSHFRPLVNAQGSWWRMGAGLGDADPQIIDQGAAEYHATLASGTAPGGQPIVVAV